MTSDRAVSVDNTEVGSPNNIVYKQSMQTLRQLLSTGVQILTIFAIADITVLGIAFRDQKAAMILLGALLMGLALVSHRSVRKWMAPYLYSAIMAEQSMVGKHNHPTLYFSGIFLDHSDLGIIIDKIAQYPSEEERQKQLLKLAVPHWFPNHLGTYTIIWLGVVGQVVLAPLLLLVGWDFL